MFGTNPPAQQRYDAMIAARTKRLNVAFEVSPHTGHKVGHSYKNEANVNEDVG